VPKLDAISGGSARLKPYGLADHEGYGFGLGLTDLFGCRQNIDTLKFLLAQRRNLRIVVFCWNDEQRLLAGKNIDAC
jgi:hypothetical protein